MFAGCNTDLLCPASRILDFEAILGVWVPHQWTVSLEIPHPAEPHILLGPLATVQFVLQPDLLEVCDASFVHVQILQEGPDTSAEGSDRMVDIRRPDGIF